MKRTIFHRLLDLNILSWASSLIVKSATRRNILKSKCKTIELKFIFSDIPVSFLRSFVKIRKWFQERDRNISKREFQIFRFTFTFHNMLLIACFVLLIPSKFTPCLKETYKNCVNQCY